MVEDLKSHLEDILKILSEDSDKEVDIEELDKELKKFLDYGVPLEQAKQTLVKKYGGKVSLTSSSERTLINDLQPNISSVNLLCRIIALNSKEIKVKGENRTIFYGIIGDESGTIPFTAWKDLEIKKGNVVEIANAYTKEWQGVTQLNFGDRVKIEKTDESNLPETTYEPKEFKVKDLRSGLGVVETTVRILELNDREVEVNGEKKKVFSGIIGDDTGKAQFTSWHDFKLKEGDVVKISGGYIKTWKGIPQLTFDEKATVNKLDSKKLLKDAVKARKMSLHELVEKRGALDVEVEGTVIEVRNGSGFVMRCPECNRVLINDECSIHGKVKGKPDLRVKLIIDDGTGSVNSIMGKEITEKLLGKTLEECKKMIESSKDENVLFDEMNSILFARRINMHGNALGDEFGTTLIAKDSQLVEVDIKTEAENLTQKLEELR